MRTVIFVHRVSDLRAQKPGDLGVDELADADLAIVMNRACTEARVIKDRDGVPQPVSVVHLAATEEDDDDEIRRLTRERDAYKWDAEQYHRALVRLEAAQGAAGGATV